MAENEVDVDVRLDKNNRTAADAARIRKNAEDAIPPPGKPASQPAAPAQPPKAPTVPAGADPAKVVRATNDEVTKLKTNVAQTETAVRGLIRQLETTARVSKIPAVQAEALKLADQARANLSGIQSSLGKNSFFGGFTSQGVANVERDILNTKADNAFIRRAASALNERDASVRRQVDAWRKAHPPPKPPAPPGRPGGGDDETVPGEGLTGKIKFASRFVLGAANLPGPDRFADQIVRRLSLATLAGIGVAGATAFGLYKIIEGYAEASDRARAFSIAALDSGQTLETLTVYATDFRGQIIGTYEDAQKLAGALAQLQTNTGGQTNSGRLANAISTIATARKLSADDASQLTRGVAAGDPNAYTRLTGRSGTLLLDNYARSIGTVASKLTEMERAQVLSNGLIQQSGRFAGEADKRIKGLAGSYDSFKSGVKDFIADYPEAFFTTFIKLRSPEAQYKAKLKELGTDITDKELREQALRAREEQAATQAEKALVNTQGTNAREAESFFKRFGQRSFAGGVAGDISRLSAISDIEKVINDRNRNPTTGGFGFGGFDRNNGFKPEDLEQYNDKIKEIKQKSADSIYEFQLAYIRKFRLLGVDDQVTRTALAQTNRIAQDSLENKDKAHLAQSFAYNADDYTKRFNAFSERNFSSPVDAAYEKQANAAQIIKDLYADVKNLSAEDFQSLLERAIEQNKAAIKEIYQLQAQARKRIRELGIEAKSSLQDAFGQANTDNPFVRLFIDADRAIEATQRKFRALGPDVVKQITDIQKAAQNTDFQKLKLTNDLDVLKLRQEAAALTRPLFGTTGQEDRQLTVLDKQIEAATKIPQLLAAAARVGKTGQPSTSEARGLFNGQFANLRGLFESAVGAGGAFGLEGANAAGAALTSLYESAPDAVKRRLGGGQKRLLQDAYRQQAAYQTYQIQKAQNDAFVTDQLTRDAYDRVALIDKSSAPDRLKLEQLINTIDQIPEKDRGNLRQRAAQARNQLAEIKERDVQDAKEREKRLDELVTALKTVVTEQGLKVVSDQALVRNVIESDTTDAPNTPSAPTTQPTPSPSREQRNRMMGI